MRGSLKAPVAAFLFLLLASVAAGQNVSYNGVIQDAQGAALPGVNVAVCPVVNGNLNTTPCTPLTQLYATRDLTQPFPVGSILQSDGNGNITFFAAPGTYAVQMYGFPLPTTKTLIVTLSCDPSFTYTSAPCQSSGGGGGGGGSSVIFLCNVPSPSNVWVCTHNLNTNTVTLSVFNTALTLIHPDSIQITGPNTIQLNWINAQSGQANIMTGANNATVGVSSVGCSSLTLLPIYSCTVTGPTTNAVVTYTLLNAPPFSFLGNATGSPAPPGYVGIPNGALATTIRIVSCTFRIGTDDGSALVNSNLGPQGGYCSVPAASTLLEVGVKANTGTPGVNPARNHLAVQTGLLSSPLVTASSGGFACANTAGTLSIDGSTTCSATLTTTSMSAGDWIDLLSGGTASTANRVSVSIKWQVN